MHDVPPLGRVGSGWLSRVGDDLVYSYKRRFVIVSHQKGFSIGIPISIYCGMELSSRRFTEIERNGHTIIYALGNAPQRLAAEPKFTKAPIAVQITGEGEALSPSPRLHYGKPQAIEHNTKVKHVGFVIPEHMQRLLLDYREETLLQLKA